MIDPRTPPKWKPELRSLDCLALVVGVEDHADVILRQAYSRGDWAAVFDEARAIKREIAALHDALAELWQLCYDNAIIS